MNIAYFNDSLLSHLGENARKSFELVGLSNSNFVQIQTDDGTKTFIEIVNSEVFDTKTCTAVYTVEEANAKITELFKPTYSVSSETIFNVSLNGKISSGAIDIDQLDESVSYSDQLKWFHDQGVKGISVSQPPALFKETENITGETYMEVQ
jgi:hypothetical protein